MVEWSKETVLVVVLMVVGDVCDDMSMVGYQPRLVAAFSGPMQMMVEVRQKDRTSWDGMGLR